MIDYDYGSMSLPTEGEIRQHLNYMSNAPVIAIDTEGTLNHPFSETWGLSYSDGVHSQYFPFYHHVGHNLSPLNIPAFKAVIENHPCVVFHHAKHDLRALRNLGINIFGRPWYCTMLMSHMVNENLFAQSLDAVSKHYGGNPKAMPPEAEVIVSKMGWRYIPSELMLSYAANDAFITKRAFDAIWPEFVSQGFNGELWNIEREFTWLLADMEDNGALIDQELSEKELYRGLGIMTEIEAELGFNPGSNKQLGEFLIDTLRLPVVKRSKKTQKPSFDKAAMEVYDELLERNSDSRAKRILTYRGWSKTTGSNYRPYLELLSKDGRLRANYKQHGTKTGRLSCEKPNLQQIPRQSAKDWNGNLKSAFIVDMGRTRWEFDYSQLELRLAAAVSRTQRLLEIFEDPTRDVFSEMASELGMDRDSTKTLNYTIQYGGGVNRVSTVFGVSREAALAIIGNYYDKFPGLSRATKRAAGLCERDGFISYWSGRRRHFWDPRSDAHKAFNSWCQGGAFEIVKRQMLAVRRAGLIGPECRLDIQVHDSAGFDIENGKERVYVPEIIRIMEDVEPDFGVKFKVDAHKWGTKESWKDYAN